MEFKQAGTANVATVYSDGNGGGATAAASYALDAYGSIVKYVKERVDVTVKNAGGATVKQFTVGDHAAVVRYDGTGYTLSGGFVDVKTILQDLATSIGGTDSKLSSGRYIKDALAPMEKTFSVRIFGAVGNGVTDDTVAIQAAIDAAEAITDGVVFFPPGTYRITSSLQCDGPTMEGVPGASKIVINELFAGDMLDLVAGTVIYGLEFELANAASTGRCIDCFDVPTASDFEIDSCIFRPASGVAIHFSATAEKSRINECEFYLANAPARVLTATGITNLFVTDNAFFISATITNPLMQLYPSCVGNTFEVTVAGPITVTLAEGGEFIANVVNPNGSNTVNLTSATYSFRERANACLPGARVCSTAGAASGVDSQSFLTTYTTSGVLTGGGSFTPEPRSMGVVRMDVNTPAGIVTVNNPTTYWEGATFELHIKNVGGSATSITWSSLYKGTLLSGVNPGNSARFRFVYSGGVFTAIHSGTFTH